MANYWNEDFTTDEAHRRWAARKKYNQVRQLRASLRRLELVRMLNSGGYGLFGDQGQQTALAAALGVHRSTVCRDLKTLFSRTD